MKYLLYIISSLIITIFNFSFAQQDLTLEDAVLKRWSSLNPEKLKDLQWNNEKDFFSYQKSDSILNIYNYDNILQNTISLNQINSSLSGEDILKKIPQITWVSSHSFRFKHNKKYFLYNIKRGQKSTIIFNIHEYAKNIEFNSQNDFYAYTIDNNLFFAKDINEYIPITKDTTQNVIYGQAVHRYEFGIYKGTFWSNNGKKIAFYRKDESMVTDYPLMRTNSRVGHVDIIKYPMAGMASHHVNLGIYNTDTDKTIYLQTGDPKEQYLTNVAWGPNDEFIYVAVLNRDQNHMKMNQYSALDGTFIKTLFEEKNDKYVQPLHSMEFISNNQFLWRSERDGVDNFYLYDISGEVIKKILKKPHVVKDFYGFKDGDVFFSSYSRDGLAIDLWRVSLNNNSKKKIINDGSYHNFQMSPSKLFAIDEFSNLETPRVTRIIELDKGDNVAVLLNSNNPLKKYNIGSTELFKINSDGHKLNARLIKPYDFDIKKKYPVLMYVYNGPGVQLIRNNWLASSPLWMHYLANQGYIVFTVDGRGSENRGRDFEQAIFGELGKIEMIDQIKGYDFLIKKPYVDSKRIAVHGWSYGGFMTTNLLLNYPNLFTCGVAGGPVTNWLYYEIMYTERYMNHPDKNQAGYEKTNLINKVHLLEDPLLMIHGLIDDIVVPQHSFDFIKESVSQNIQMDYFIYPGHPHNIRGKDRLHLIQKIIDYIRANNN